MFTLLSRRTVSFDQCGDFHNREKSGNPIGASFPTSIPIRRPICQTPLRGLGWVSTSFLCQGFITIICHFIIEKLTKTNIEKLQASIDSFFWDAGLKIGFVLSKRS